MTTFAESLDRLWQLQGLDARIEAARQRIASEERRAKEQETRIQRARKDVTRLEAELKQAQVRNHEIEDELKRLDERIRKIEAVAGSEHEVEKHRAAIDELETEGLTLMGEVPERQSGIARAHDEIAGLEATLADLRQAAQQAAEREQSAIAALQTEREAIAAQVPEEVLKSYQHLAERHAASVLCWVNGEFCAGCSGELNMQHIVRAKQRSEFVRCPHCSRILDPGA
jgi:uncharacterized protein